MALRTRFLLLVVSVVTLFSVPAFAAKKKVAALDGATVRAEAKADAASVIEIKKGDMVTVLGKQGEWSQVLTSDGKKGWVPSKVVETGGFGSMDAGGTTVAAAEGTSAIGIRARPSKIRTVVIAAGGTKVADVKALSDLLKKEKELMVVDTRADATIKAETPAGGVEGAAKLGESKKADLVIALRKVDGGAMAYEVVDVKNRTVLSTGTTEASKDAKIVTNKVAVVVRESVAKIPSGAAAVSNTAASTGTSSSGASTAPTPTPAPVATGHPNAPLGDESKGGGMTKEPK